MDKLIEKKIEKLKKKRAGNLKKKTANQESRRCKDPKYYLTLFHFQVLFETFSFLTTIWRFFFSNYYLRLFYFQVVFSICQVPYYPTIVWLHRSADVLNY